MTKGNWVLLWVWVVFVVGVGPFLISARDWFLVAGGLTVFAWLIWATQRVVRAKLNKETSK